MLSEEKLLNAGLCALVSVDGSDMSPVEAARTSYGDLAGNHTQKENEGLDDYLIRKSHGGPLEFTGITFYMVLPIFVARQLIRHRIGVSINEESLRYVEPRKEFYIPEASECKTQSQSSKQGSSDTLVDSPKDISRLIEESGNASHMVYQSLLDTGLSKELCRTVLPLGQYSAWYMKFNLRSIFALLTLRLDSHVQEQTKVYAESMLRQIEPYFPVCIKAWKNHVLNSVTFSQDEWKVVKYLIEMSSLSGVNICNAEDRKVIVTQKAKSDGLRGTRVNELLEKLGEVVNGSSDD